MIFAITAVCYLCYCHWITQEKLRESALIWRLVILVVCVLCFLQFMQVLFFHCLTCMMCNEVLHEKPLRSCRAGLVGIIGP